MNSTRYPADSSGTVKEKGRKRQRCSLYLTSAPATVLGGEHVCLELTSRQ